MRVFEQFYHIMPLFTFVLTLLLMVQKEILLPPSILPVNQSHPGFNYYSCIFQTALVYLATPYSICHKIYQIIGKENKINMELQVYLMKRYLKWYFRCHGETVGDDGLFLCCATFPAVQLNAAAAWQKNLLVHLHWRVPGKLASCTPQKKRTTFEAGSIPKVLRHVHPCFKSVPWKKRNCGANL